MTRSSKKITILFSFLAIFLVVPFFASARELETITDWYVRDFQTTIQVNTDSSLLVTENITADVGNVPDKHGIFRILPTRIATEKGTFKTPIELVSITDFNSQPYHYETSKNNVDHTITWKIGDAVTTVTGVNNYRIIYKVKNAIRGNTDVDELYWNLLGNFWELEIDTISARIMFPLQITSQNTQINYYTGSLGSKNSDLADSRWITANTLAFTSTRPLKVGEGITVSVTFPKGIVTLYTPTFLENYGDYLWFFIPLIVLLGSFFIWKKYGKDPKMKSPIPPEFGIPEKITPMQMGMVLHSGKWKDTYITATIVDFAVRKLITIEEVKNKVLLFTHKDIVLKKVANDLTTGITESEKILLEDLFSGNNDSVHLSEAKKTFYLTASKIKKAALYDVDAQGWVKKRGLSFMVGFIAIAAFLFFISFSFIAGFANLPLFASLLISAAIVLIFGFLMPQRTQKGVDLLFKIKGFELYMKQAEDYRQQFYEKENIFDTFLPYAIVFGIAELWAKKMELIYGKEFWNTYHPVWFVGNYGTFNVNSFTSQLNSITQSMSAVTGTSSGSGGGGFSGGGGGGGGGGGW